ncbi:MAG: bifunctional ADP-dependent NAD(P)H-hydrate dehydratase/NAD(P)H-hydrate epimerase [Candidatus Zixiibacteriota bacterium]|nr:MAG: bifunctional ADP-dependent NAD(P)H-hydrate dehydratase/NAD(P)H-hydrate epimerase [candidate division Zixibacteria bacterium]
MKICTPKQMREIDRKAIKGMGIPGLELMENAGKGAFEMIVDYYGPVEGNRIIIACGKGNNGGDGLVVARYLKENGAHVEVILLCKKDTPKGDAVINLKKAEKLDIPIKEVLNPEQFHIPDDTWLFVDAIFGTGFTGDIHPPYDKIIDKINDLDIPIVSIDCPSGLDSATGKVSTPTVKADLTVTFGLPKIGQVLYPGKSYCGSLEVIDIGFPAGLDNDINTHFITKDDAFLLLPLRKPDAHKGDYGKLFVLAGSTGLTGAASMASMAALKCGTGLVVLGCPATLNSILETKLTEVMTKPLPDVKKQGCFALRGMGEIRQQIEWADSVAIGPGIGTHHETVELVKRLATQIEKPMVIDADGLNNLAKAPETLKRHKGPLVISPHPGEFSRLTSINIDKIVDNRIKLAASFASEHNLTIILKGAPSIIAAPSGVVYINSSGNEGMATAGSGDVLTGLIGGFLAQGLSSEHSAILATYVHGLAGDIAGEIYGGRGTIAGDILDCVPEALLELEGFLGIDEDIEDGSYQL